MRKPPPPGRATDLRRLTDVSRALTYATSMEDVLGLTVDCALDLLTADKALLMLMGEDGLLRIRAARGIDDEVIGHFHEPFDETLVARLESLFGAEAKQHFLGVPLVVRGQVIGMLAVHRDSAEPVREEEEWLLSALADQASIALDAAGHDADREALESELWLLEDRRRRLQSALAVASHDLRTPLNSIQGYIELLTYRETGPLNEAQRDLLEKARTVGRHFHSVLEDVLAMARLTSGTERFTIRDFPLAEVVNEALVLVAPPAAEKEVKLEVEVDPDVLVRADFDRVRQVLLHLLDNAVKYSGDGTTVRVACADDGPEGPEKVRVSVSDEGPGIPPERAERAFEPYQRLAPESPSDPGGTGLGLSIARGLIMLMGGTIEFDPRAGSGTTIVFRLPRGRDNRVPGPPGAPGAGRSGGSAS